MVESWVLSESRWIRAPISPTGVLVLWAQITETIGTASPCPRSPAQTASPGLDYWHLPPIPAHFPDRSSGRVLTPSQQSISPLHPGHTALGLPQGFRKACLSLCFSSLGQSKSTGLNSRTMEGERESACVREHTWACTSQKCHRDVSCEETEHIPALWLEVSRKPGLCAEQMFCNCVVNKET